MKHNGILSKDSALKFVQLLGVSSVSRRFTCGGAVASDQGYCGVVVSWANIILAFAGSEPQHRSSHATGRTPDHW
jgi:hypothetical protein